MVDGNSAAALGAIYGGMTVMAWYPITPSTSLADSLSNYAEMLRSSDDGSATYAIVQAEDELAAVGMVLDAGWVGARDDGYIQIRHQLDVRIRLARLSNNFNIMSIIIEISLSFK